MIVFIFYQSVSVCVGRGTMYIRMYSLLLLSVIEPCSLVRYVCTYVCMYVHTYVSTYIMFV